MEGSVKKKKNSNAHMWHISVWYSQVGPGQLQATC